MARLTNWSRVTHICVANTTIIGSDNGLSPGRRQAINWTNDGILSIGPLGTNFSDNLIEIHISSFKKNAFENVVWKMAAIFPGLNVLSNYNQAYLWDVMTHPCPNFHCDSTKPTLKLGHGCVITSHCSTWMWFHIHTTPPQGWFSYREISNIRRTKSQSFTVSRFGLQLSLRNIFKPSVKWRMKM